MQIDSPIGKQIQDFFSKNVSITVADQEIACGLLDKLRTYFFRGLHDLLALSSQPGKQRGIRRAKEQ
jgi:hypothetical protein